MEMFAFNKRTMIRILLAAILSVTPSIGWAVVFSSYAQQPADRDLADTPITLLGSNNGTYTAEQKLRIYNASVALFLENVRRNHPEFVPQLAVFFNKPVTEYGGESRGFHDFKGSIDKVIANAKANGSDLSKIYALSVVARNGSDYIQSEVLKSPPKKDGPHQ